MNFRNPLDAANHSENAAIGVIAAIATTAPMRFAAFLNKCKADANKTATNQIAINPASSFP